MFKIVSQSRSKGGELGFGYFALDYKSESLKFTTYTPEKVTDLEIEVLQYYNPLVRNNFKQFLNGLLEIQPTGYEFRINSVVRSFADAIRIYKGEGNNFTSLSSMHFWVNGSPFPYKRYFFPLPSSWSIAPAS